MQRILSDNSLKQVLLMAGKHLEKNVLCNLKKKNTNWSNNEMAFFTYQISKDGKKMKLSMMELTGVNNLWESPLAISKSLDLVIPVLGLYVKKRLITKMFYAALFKRASNGNIWPKGNGSFSPSNIYWVPTMQSFPETAQQWLAVLDESSFKMWVEFV